EKVQYINIKLKEKEPDIMSELDSKLNYSVW
ncbi:unnamed protein product, partial [marine sediment metagenome]